MRLKYRDKIQPTAKDTQNSLSFHFMGNQYWQNRLFQTFKEMLQSVGLLTTYHLYAVTEKIWNETYPMPPPPILPLSPSLPLSLSPSHCLDKNASLLRRVGSFRISLLFSLGFNKVQWHLIQTSTIPNQNFKSLPNKQKHRVGSP